MNGEIIEQHVAKINFLRLVLNSNLTVNYNIDEICLAKFGARIQIDFTSEKTGRIFTGSGFITHTETILKPLRFKK